jgi:hypothetical protein
MMTFKRGRGERYGVLGQFDPGPSLLIALTLLAWPGPPPALQAFNVRPATQNDPKREYVPGSIFAAADHLIQLLVKNGYVRRHRGDDTDEERFAKALFEFHSTIFYSYEVGAGLGGGLGGGACAHRSPNHDRVRLTSTPGNVAASRTVHGRGLWSRRAAGRTPPTRPISEGDFVAGMCVRSGACLPGKFLRNVRACVRAWGLYRSINRDACDQ